MAGITAHIIDKDGYFICSRSGDVASVMLAIDIEETDYTLEPPPLSNGDIKYRWLNNEWIADKTVS